MPSSRGAFSTSRSPASVDTDASGSATRLTFRGADPAKGAFFGMVMSRRIAGDGRRGTIGPVAGDSASVRGERGWR
jgi:hypothetical protein